MESSDPLLVDVGNLVDDGACNGVVLGAVGDEDRDGVAGVVVRAVKQDDGEEDRESSQ